MLWSSPGATEEDQPTVDPERFAGPGERAGAQDRARARLRAELEDHYRGVGSVLTS
jgi:hypothetical protein